MQRPKADESRAMKGEVRPAVTGAGQEDAVMLSCLAAQPGARRSGQRFAPGAGPIVCEAAAWLRQRRRRRHRRRGGHARDPTPPGDPVTTWLVSAVRVDPRHRTGYDAGRRPGIYAGLLPRPRSGWGPPDPLPRPGVFPPG